MKRQKLKVKKRVVLGKKVKKLRKEGVLPANIYGKELKSIAVQLPYKEFEKAYKEAGETGLVDVEIDGQTKPSLIHNVQINHYKNTILHADFYQVNLKEKVKAMVPIKVVGNAKAVADKLGLLLQPLSQIEVEALPEDLPENIEVNVEPLATVGNQITVGDIKPPKGVTVLSDPSQVVVKIGELVSKEAQAQEAAEKAAIETAKATTTTAVEGTKPEEAKAAKPEEKSAAEISSKTKPQAKPDQKEQQKPQEKP